MIPAGRKPQDGSTNEVQEPDYTTDWDRRSRWRTAQELFSGAAVRAGYYGSHRWKTRKLCRMSTAAT